MLAPLEGAPITVELSLKLVSWNLSVELTETCLLNSLKLVCWTHWNLIAQFTLIIWTVISLVRAEHALNLARFDIVYTQPLYCTSTVLTLQFKGRTECFHSRLHSDNHHLTFELNTARSKSLLARFVRLHYKNTRPDTSLVQPSEVVQRRPIPGPD